MVRCVVLALLVVVCSQLALSSGLSAEAAVSLLPDFLLPREVTTDHELRVLEKQTSKFTNEDGHHGDNGDEVSGGGTETRIDFGTKSWPYVYYARRDQKGTVDWGTMAWPYIYYSRQDGKGHREGKRDTAGKSFV